MAKDTTLGVEKQCNIWKETLASYLFHRGLIFMVYKEFKSLNTKRTINPTNTCPNKLKDVLSSPDSDASQLNFVFLAPESMIFRLSCFKANSYCFNPFLLTRTFRLFPVSMGYGCKASGLAACWWYRLSWVGPEGSNSSKGYSTNKVVVEWIIGSLSWLEDHWAVLLTGTVSLVPFFLLPPIFHGVSKPPSSLELQTSMP